MDTTRRVMLQGAGLGALGAVLPVARAHAADPAAMTLSTSAADLARLFKDPPPEARPAVFWYWMNGVVTQEGIGADLAAMAEAGFGRAILFSIGLGAVPAGMKQYPSLSPEWWDMLDFAIREAGRVGIAITMGACDGWATSAGPWITPALSMQRVTWSETRLAGGRRFAGRLARPFTVMDHYRDIRTIAFPMPEAWSTSVERAVAVANAFGLADSARLNRHEPAAETLIESDRAGWIEYRFDRPFTVRAIVAEGPDGGAGAGLSIEASDDGSTFRAVGRLAQPDEHTLAQRGGVTTETTRPETLYVIDGTPAVTAKTFRIVFTPGAGGPGGEQHFAGPNGDPMVPAAPPRLRLSRLLLLDERPIPQLNARAARTWSLPPPDVTDADLPPATCIRATDIVDLTARVGADGALDWTPPDDRLWKVVRIGHTANGAINGTGFPAGRGLECDKLNPAATRVQFDGWLGQIARRVDKARAGRALTTMHTDSWECGAQNWSPVFPAEFTRRRGYDLLRYVPIMAGVPIDDADTVNRVLADLRRTIGEATDANFFAELARLGRQAGYDYSAEPANPIYPTDALMVAKHADRPMGEFWTYGDDKPSDVAEAIHGGHVYGRRIISAEAFTEFAMQWSETPYSCKPLGDANWAKGMNQLTCHVWAAQPWIDAAHEPGMTLANIGVFFSRTNTWFEAAKPWFDYLKRGQALLQQGRPVIDVACFVGEDIPSRAYVPANTPLPIPEGYQFDSLNPDAVMNLAQVREGWIVLPSGQRYALMVLPRRYRATPALLRRIDALVRAGATVVGAPPAGVFGLMGEAEVADLVRILWSPDAALHRHGKGRIGTADDLAPLLAARGATPDCVILDPVPPPGEGGGILWTHRSGPDWHLYFLSNQSKQPVSARARLRVDSATAELWDADTGKVSAIAGRRVGGGCEIDVPLDPCGSAFLLFRNGSANPPPAIIARSEKIRTPITGPWRITFARGLDRPKMIEAMALESWSRSSDPAIRFYAGSATYETMVTIADPGASWQLDLGDVAELCDVEVNGRLLRRLWKPPFHVALDGALQQGANRLVVRVVNTWRNRLVGDADRPQVERSSFTVTPFFDKHAPSFGPSYDPALMGTDADGFYRGGGFDNDARGVPLRGSPAGTPPPRLRRQSRYGFAGGGSSAPGPDVRRVPDENGLLPAGLLGPVFLIRKEA